MIKLELHSKKYVNKIKLRFTIKIYEIIRSELVTFHRFILIQRYAKHPIKLKSANKEFSMLLGICQIIFLKTPFIKFKSYS